MRLIANGHDSHSHAFIYVLAGLGIFQFTGRDVKEAKFDPSGYFIPLESQKNASCVRWLLLSEDHRPNGGGPLYLELRVGTERRWKTFRQASLKIEGERIRFRTKVRDGVHYDFEGRFLPSSREKELGEFEDVSGCVALRGVLKTIQSGKIKVAEGLSFFYSTGK